MAYVDVVVRENDLLNGIFVKAGGFIPDGGSEVFHLHEEDYRRGVYVKGLRCAGYGIVAHTWTDGYVDYRASSYPSSEDTDVVDVEQYGGTMEQFERHQEQHALLMKSRGMKQGAFVHFPADMSLTGQLG